MALCCLQFRKLGPILSVAVVTTSRDDKIIDSQTDAVNGFQVLHKVCTLFFIMPVAFIY